ncbi:MAG: 4Fe-4S dicluster domain-containing protein [Dehalococcoidia bacterium]
MSEEQGDTVNGPQRPWSRRQVIGGLGAAGLAVAATFIPLNQIPVVSRADAAEPAARTPGKRQWGMVIDMRLCDGCKECTVACQKAHFLPKDHEWIKVIEIKRPEGASQFMPRLCQMCENPPCLKVCPTGATFKNPEGVVLIDQSKCIGCRMCMVACPYEARYFNFRTPPKGPAGAKATAAFPVPQQIGTVGKCELCTHETESGRLPACVAACSMDALFIADLNSDVMANGSGGTFQVSKYLADNDGYRYKEDLNTSPRVWYIAGHGQNLEF